MFLGLKKRIKVLLLQHDLAKLEATFGLFFLNSPGPQGQMIRLESLKSMKLSYYYYSFLFGPGQYSASIHH